MSKNVNLIKTDIGNLFQELETIATETKLEEKKKRGYVEPSVSDISNLFKGLEEASRQAKELSSEDTEKLGAFSGLMEQMTTITKKVEDDVTTQINEVVTEFVEEEITHEEEDELREFVEEKPKEPEQPPEKSANIIEKIVDNLDEMRYNTEVKEELDQIEALRKEFEQYKTALQNQVTKGLATSSGGGEVRLEFLDDVDRDTAKVDGKYLKFDSSSGKFIGADATPTNESIQDLIGDMVSSNTESGITVTYQDADGTLDFTIGTLNQDTTGNANTATALEIARTINGTSFDGSANITVTAAAGTVTGNTLNSGVTASSLTSVGTLTTLTVDNIVVNGTTIGHTDDTDLITLADGIATIAGELSVTTLDIGGTNVTSTAAEINLIDGGTSRGTTAVASGDGILINDGGTMRMTNVDTVSTYFSSHNVGGGNIVTTGALNSGSITSGFGTINTGSSAITTTGLISGGSLDIDDVLINGTTIGHTDDTDLITLADGLVTIAGELNVTGGQLRRGDRVAALQPTSGTIALVDGFTLNGTDDSSSNAGDFLVLNTAADNNDRMLLEDDTSDPIAVLASHGITLSGQGWNAFQFDNG